MSNPSFDNIDKWLFEYMEGNLSPSQLTQLEKFMLNNPEYDPDMDAWQLAKVDATPVTYPGTLGRKRRALPFWIKATTALTTVFVIGGFAGAFLNSLSNDKDPLFAESAAQVQLLEIKTTSLERESQVQPINNASISTASFKRSEMNSLPVSEITKSILVPSNYSASILPFKRMNTTEKKANLNQRKISDISLLKVDEDTFEADSDVAFVPNSPNSVMEMETEKISKSNEKSLNEREQAETEGQQDLKSRAKEKEETAQVMTRGQNKYSSNYNKSFSSKLKSVGRKIIKMTENPVALSNSKEIYYHVPGMQTLNVNAASAGNLLTSRFTMTSRAQWTGHSNQQLLNEISYDTYIKNIRGGIGIQASHGYYDVGTYSFGQLALTYSPKLSVSKNFSIEPAIRFKMGDKRLNSLDLIQGQMVEFERGNEKVIFSETPENSVKDLWYKDVALAIQSNTKWFSVGFQADNLGRHFNNVYDSKLENNRSGIHYTAHLGTDFVSRSKIISFSPYIMCQKVENLSEIWGGSIFRYKNLTFGGAYSSSGDYVGSIGLKTKLFMLSYNADKTQSNLIGKRLFSQQLTVRILMNNGRYGQNTMLKQ